MSELGFPIRAVSQMTGLSQHTIRAWEKRYGVVDPDRTGTNRRLYTTYDVDRLKLFKRAGEMGHGLAQLSTLSNAAISELIGQSRPDRNGEATDLATQAIQATRDLDAETLEATLDYALALEGADGVVDGVVLPLLSYIDEQWASGSLTIAQEHAASAVLRPFLHRARKAMRATVGAPHIVITTLPGELHEIGALIASLIAAGHGWRVTYLGPSLPLEEIALATTQAEADAIGISIVSPRPERVTELERLRELAGDRVQILVGGREAKETAQMTPIGIRVFEDLEDLRRFLDTKA